MGFIRKVGKKIGRGIKKLGKAIKKGFGKLTKAFGKLGPIGHLAMGLILPGMGGVLGEWLKTFGSKALSLMPQGMANVIGGLGSAISKGASIAYNNTVGVIHKTITGGLEWGLNQISNIAGVPEGMGLGDKFSNFMDNLNDKMAGLKPTNDYTIQAGDTLTSIAENTGMSVDRLKNLNPELANPDFIKAGESLKIKGSIPLPKGEKGPLEELKQKKIAGTDLTVEEGFKTAKDVNTVVQTIGTITSDANEESSPFYNRNIGQAEDVLYDRDLDVIQNDQYSFVNLLAPKNFNELTHQYITGFGATVPQDQQFGMFNKLSPIGFNPVTYSMGGYDQ